MNQLKYIEIAVGLIAAVLIFSAQLTYLKGILKILIKPSVLSWLGWAILMGTSLFSQIIAEGWEWSHTGILISTIGCASIGITALITKNFLINKIDWFFLILGLACIVLYVISKDPWSTTLFAIAADLIIGIPTILKTIKEPNLERSPAWLLGLITWSLTLSISFHNGILFALFPIYLFLHSVLMVSLLYFRKSK